MRIENLLPFLVPLTFIALWAITSIFNRDAQPLPSRPVRPPGPGFDPRTQRPLFRPGLAPNSLPPEAATRPVALPRGADMVLLDLKTSNPVKEGEAGLRRASKARKRGGAKPSKKEIPTSSGMSRSLGESIGETVGAGQSLSPLSLPPSPLLEQNSSSLSTFEAASVSTSKGPSAREIDIRSLLRSRSRLQEAWILSEVLLPPLSLRKRGNGRA